MANFFETNFVEADRYIRLAIRGNEQRFTPLLEVSSFLYDFNLLYEISRLAIDPAYEFFRFTAASVYRTGRPLDDGDRLHVESVRLGSPIELNTILVAVPAAATTLWIMLQAANLANNWRLNHRKLKAEVEKIERENAERRSLPPQQSEPPAVNEKRSTREEDARLAELLENAELVERRLERREALTIYRRVGERLKRSTIYITEVEVEVIERLPSDDKNR